MTDKQFATSAGHWYGKDGAAQYEIVGVNGKQRPTTLRDARVYGLLPSVTTIINCAAQPQLERWKRNQLLLSVLTLPRIAGESEKDYLARVEQDWQQEGRDARDRGEAIHGAIERHYRREGYSQEWTQWVIAASNKLAEACGDQEWLPERSFAHHSGYGGKVDLHSPQWVVDIKTKDGDHPTSTYESHWMQLSAYRSGLGHLNARAGIVYVGRDDPVASFVEVTDEELAKGLSMFNALLAFWKAKNNYYPEAA